MAGPLTSCPRSTNTAQHAQPPSFLTHRSVQGCIGRHTTILRIQSAMPTTHRFWSAPTRATVHYSLIFSLLTALSCGESRSTDDGMTSTAESSTSEDSVGSMAESDSTSDDETGDDAQPDICASMLDCVAAVSPAEAPLLLGLYGTSGSCWELADPAERELCEAACETILETSVATCLPETENCELPTGSSLCCMSENDGACDVSLSCPSGTDKADCLAEECASRQANGVCDEPDPCQIGTDRFDCLAPYGACSESGDCGQGASCQVNAVFDWDNVPDNGGFMCTTECGESEDCPTPPGASASCSEGLQCFIDCVSDPDCEPIGLRCFAGHCVP